EGLDDLSVSKSRTDGRADAAVNFCTRNTAFAAEGFEATGEILVRPQPHRKGTSGCIRAGCLRRHSAEQLEPRLGVRLGLEDRTIDAERLPLERLGDVRFLRQHMTTADTAIGLAPQSVTMEKRRAIAGAQRHGRELQPRDSRRTKGVAIKRRVLA